MPDEVCLGYAEQSIYNPAGGLLAEYIDRNGRATSYQYNLVGQETLEKWYAGSNTSASATETVSFSYNPAGRLQTATDQVAGAESATDSYTYNLAGAVLGDSQSVCPVSRPPSA